MMRPLQMRGVLRLGRASDLWPTAALRRRGGPRTRGRCNCQRLAAPPDTTPFVGAAVMMPMLDSPDVTISLGVCANLSNADRRAVDELASSLGLAEI